MYINTVKIFQKFSTGNGKTNEQSTTKRYNIPSFASNKGLLAMDESNGTCNKRFASAGISQTVETRFKYRELINTTPVSYPKIAYQKTIKDAIKSAKKVKNVASHM